jgi:transaldolase/glucose-6-phosphate isomerase
MTSNPSIFQQSIAASEDYDKDIEQGLDRKATPAQIFEHLAVKDVQRACDIIRPVYEETNGADGFVSIEVSPGTAYDTQQTMEEAARLWASVNRPNVMVKIPGTDHGLPAIKAMLAQGVNINITLLFSLKQYRVDNVVDKQLEQKGRKQLAGKAAVANACMAYGHFLEVAGGERWKKLAARGARVQRPLWASTSTKNPEYSDILYVQELIAADTVNTMPPQTLEAFKDHGQPQKSLLKNLETADKVLHKLAETGIDMDKVTSDLIDDGVKKFAESYDKVLEAIEEKERKKLSAKQRA